MSNILISGLVNVETSTAVQSFPVSYCPIEYPFFGVNVEVGGVGYNVAKAMKTLGDEVRLCGFLGNDLPGKAIETALKEEGIADNYLRKELQMTPTSTILFDAEGKRKIYCDLKDIQDRSYPISDELFENIDCAVLTNINFSRSLIQEAKRRGIPVATDVHAIGSFDDSYNQEFLENADILFFSNACFEGRESEAIMECSARFHNKIIVVGSGEKGALLFRDDEQAFFVAPSKKVRPIVSTVGAGDALFSCFLHFYLKGETPESALTKATWFAGYKIGEASASKGFLDENELRRLMG